MRRTHDVKNQNHYARYNTQPVEFIANNNIPYLEGNVIKYLLRYKYKGTPEDDLAKAQHYLEMVIEQNKDGFIEL